MSGLIFVTGNADKFIIAQQILAPHGIVLQQKNFDIDEIQSENAEEIARKKASAAFDLLKQPLIVRDDAWSFMGLRGFPGPYMKSMNHWLTNDDFIRLTLYLDDRRAILTQTLVYQDADEQKVFSHQATAYLLTEARGNSKSPSENIMTLEGDGGKSISEVMASDTQHANRTPAEAWHEFINWYKVSKL